MSWQKHTAFWTLAEKGRALTRERVQNYSNAEERTEALFYLECYAELLRYKRRALPKLASRKPAAWMERQAQKLSQQTAHFRALKTTMDDCLRCCLPHFATVQTAMHKAAIDMAVRDGWWRVSATVVSV
jgi:hypothetical protein